MSWDAYLYSESDDLEYETNYTHNTNNMANHVLGLPVAESVFQEVFGGRESWWQRLNGKSGTEGAELLDHIVSGLRSDPPTYLAMNPENGWGDCDSFLARLVEMQAVSEKHPAGRWRVSG